MELGLRGKTAFVIGGSEGIGLALAKELHRAGCAVVITGRRPHVVKAAVAGFLTNGSKVAGYAGDMVEATALQSVLNQARQEVSDADIVVLVPPTPAAGTFFSIGEADMTFAYEGLVLTFMRLVQATAGPMRAKRWGRYLTVGSSTVKTPIRSTHNFGYVTANCMRMAAAALSKTLAAELAPHGITVNTIATGMIDTPAAHRFWVSRAEELGISVEQFLQNMFELSPMRRMGTMEEMASLGAFLCSDLAGYTTGEAILCDGGFSNPSI